MAGEIKDNSSQEMADLELGASLLAAMKKGKGDKEGAAKWREVAKTAS